MFCYRKCFGVEKICILGFVFSEMMVCRNQQPNHQTGGVSTGQPSLATSVYQSLDTSLPNVVVYDHITRNVQVAPVNRDPQLTSTNDYENVAAAVYSN